jgi:hypothetical protein
VDWALVGRDRPESVLRCGRSVKKDDKNTAVRLIGVSFVVFDADPFRNFAATSYIFLMIRKIPK